MKKTWNQIIREELSRTGISQAELARAVGISEASVSAWLSGATKTLKAENAEKAARKLGISTRYLLTGKQEVRESPGDYRPGPPVGDYEAAPVVGIAQLGPDGFWSDFDHPVGHGDGYVDVPTRDPNAYALRVKGDSMAPAIRNGWLVVIEPNHRAVTGELVMVCTDDGRCMVKELLAERESEVYLGSVNQDHKPITIDKESITRLHYVGFIAPPSKLRL
jgi:phage repressor protein C with HTH and peptisase S24 domain